MCVAVPHGLVVVSVSDYKAKQLRMYSLIDGTRIRSIGSEGSGKGQFDFGYGGLCVSPDGDSVLVAERYNNRVQEVRIVDGSWVRFVGEGVLNEPQYVDCNADVIAVSESSNNRISVLAWEDGSMLAQFGSYGRGGHQLLSARGIRLLADGSGVVVADCLKHRLCIFTLSGELVAAVDSVGQGVNYPRDVLECGSDGSFIAASWGSDNLVKLSRDGVKVEMYGRYGCGDGQFNGPSALAALPNDGCCVLDFGNTRVQQLAHLRARLAWMRACVRRVM